MYFFNSASGPILDNDLQTSPPPFHIKKSRWDLFSILSDNFKTEKNIYTKFSEKKFENEKNFVENIFFFLHFFLS